MIVFCEQCAAEISDGAAACPKCGAAVASPRKRSLKIPGLLLLGVGVGALVFRHFDHYLGAEGWLLLVVAVLAETGGMALVLWGFMVGR